MMVETIVNGYPNWTMSPKHQMRLTSTASKG